MNILRGIYTAASGMLVEAIRMDVASNNLANVDTAGFQRQTAHVYAFRIASFSSITKGGVHPWVCLVQEPLRTEAPLPLPPEC